MLEANPRLNWLDIQVILVETASRNDVLDSSWQLNSGNRYHSQKYGFGTINTNLAVRKAKSFESGKTEQSVIMPEKDVLKDIDDNGNFVTSTVEVEVINI